MILTAGSVHAAPLRTPANQSSPSLIIYVETYQKEHASEVAELILISTLLAMIVVPLALTFRI